MQRRQFLSASALAMAAPLAAPGIAAGQGARILRF
ncbi:MAG: hypothetical protein JWP04_1299, partial [Belnapia sp.]|nr:hypothetical protein [Belnapia sp.]